ncbi:MAG: winged helix-turn-helix domain-containing protein [Acidimicrobiales bacterium]
MALAAQGFTDPAPTAPVGRRHLGRVLGRVGLVQIDSVNVLVRSHYLPAFSRLGPYPVALLDAEAYRRRTLFECWGHEASLAPVSLYPCLRWRMERGHAWGGPRRLAAERPGYLDDVMAEVASRGPITAAQLSDPGAGRGPWWGWSDGKEALEWLLWSGQVAVAGRHNFQRSYDLPERVIPPEVLAAPAIAEDEAHRRLLVKAAAALGVGTAEDLIDYFRLRGADARPRLAELVEAGELEPVEVDGWGRPAYRHPAARLPRRVEASALLSPFDSLIWGRARTERMWGFRYRLEIYVPAPKRIYGYYVLPFLLGESLAARVDVKADRARSTLLVRGAFLEPAPPPPAGRGPRPAGHGGHNGRGPHGGQGGQGGYGAQGARGARAVAGPLSHELVRMAEWLGLEQVEVADRGDLAPALARSL